jgi:thiol-disulfide isomerase/thioredoxin
LKNRVVDIPVLSPKSQLIGTILFFTTFRFYAPWCKTCRKLSLNLKKVAIDYGDTIVNRIKLPGIVRFAQVEYSPRLEKFITQILQIQGVPTIQIFYQSYKLYDVSGTTSTKDVVEQIKAWQLLHVDEKVEYAKQRDDGVLQSAIDNLFYDDYPDFLDEEW